jgi:hypothetical protein
LIASTDQILRFRRIIHARRPLRQPIAEVATGRPLAVRSSRTGETGATDAPHSWAGARVTLSHRWMPAGTPVMQNATLLSWE